MPFYLFYFILIKRYLAELYSVPFSQDAQYIIWKEAYFRFLKKTFNSTGAND